MATAVPVLTSVEVSEHLRDDPSNNHLLDGVEFDPAFINLSIKLAISEFNSMPPMGSVDIYTFPSKAILMSGTLYKMFAAQSALLARNHMNYSDGGLQIPVEERFQLYQALAELYRQDFANSARALKTQMNLEDGWGGVKSDYSAMPTW